MKIVSLNGSPRRNGSTSEVLKVIEQELIVKSHEAEEMVVAELSSANDFQKQPISFEQAREIGKRIHTTFSEKE